MSKNPNLDRTNLSRDFFHSKTDLLENLAISTNGDFQREREMSKSFEKFFIIFDSFSIPKIQ